MILAFRDNHDGYYELDIPSDGSLPEWTYNLIPCAILPPQVPTPEQVQESITNTIQQRLDNFAHTRGYDSILSACTYATSLNEKFKAEGQHCVESRDSHWATAYSIMADVMAGKREIPTVDQVIAEMPSLNWP